MLRAARLNALKEPGEKASQTHCLHLLAPAPKLTFQCVFHMGIGEMEVPALALGICLLGNTRQKILEEFHKI